MARAAFARNLACLCTFCAACLAPAQHLAWKLPHGHKLVTAVYGEIQVLADNPGTYYCGCDWWPSMKGAGYTGIQNLRTKGKRIIFSVWDTSPELHPSVIAADPRVIKTAFKGEGTGAHTHMPYEWQVGHIYRFYVTKRLDITGKNCIETLYFYDEGQNRWLMEGQILGPRNGKPTVDGFDGLGAFVENLRDKEDKQRETPKFALFRLWAGTGPDDLALVTDAMGKQKWGKINGSFFLCEGDDLAIQQVIRANLAPGQTVEFGSDTLRLTVPSQPMPAGVLEVLRGLK